MKWLALMGLFSTFTSCQTLTPYSEAIAHLPPDDFVEIDGQTIHAPVRGSGPDLVLLHGFAASTYSYEKVIPALAEKRRVIAIDLNGFGYTERPSEPEAYRFENQLATINAVLDRLDVDQFSVVGHSYGGALALAMAAQAPTRIEKLVLISPATEFETPPWYLRTAPGKAIGWALVRSLVAKPERLAKVYGNAYHQKDVFTIEVAEAYRKRLAIEGLHDAYRGYGDAMASGGDISLPIDEVRLATLILAGRHDNVVALESLKGLAVRLHDFEFTILENSGHSGPEEEPAAVSDAILEFLR